MTTMDIGLTIWLFLCAIIAAFVARKSKVIVIRVPFRDGGLGGPLFVVKKKGRTHMILARHSDNVDVIDVRIVDGAVQVKQDDDRLTDITDKTEGRLWRRWDT